MTTPRSRPVRPWQHWRFAVTVTFCWLVRRHFLRPAQPASMHGRLWRCRVCRSNVLVRKTWEVVA